MIGEDSAQMKRSSSEEYGNGGFFVDDVGSSSASSTPENPVFSGRKGASSLDKKKESQPLLNSAGSFPSEIRQADSSFPDNFHKSPEPIPSPKRPFNKSVRPPSPSSLPHTEDHQYNLLRKIQEDKVSNDGHGEIQSSENETHTPKLSQKSEYFTPCYNATKIIHWISNRVFQQEDFAVASWMGFWALLNVTCANYVLSPMRDAVALQVGVKNIPKLTLASSVLAFLSSVPIGWLFEAPDPSRRKVWKKMGLTRGETQGTSLALFYRFFALSVLSYAAGFQIVDLIRDGGLSWLPISGWFVSAQGHKTAGDDSFMSIVWEWVPYLISKLGKVMYIAFFLVVHLMKLHSMSLVWGVTTEAMEYEDVARKGQERKLGHTPKKSKTRLQRLSMVGFGGTLGGIWGR
jgi:hypothetical protein